MRNIIIIILFCIVLFIEYINGYIDGYFKFHDSLCKYNNLSSIRIGTKVYCTDGNKIIDLKLIK